MFDVGFWELVLIGGLALVILGPTRLPRVAREVGRWVGRARMMARQLRSQLEQEVSYDEHMRAQARPEAGQASANCASDTNAAPGSASTASDTSVAPESAPAPDASPKNDNG